MHALCLVLTSFAQQKLYPLNHISHMLAFILQFFIHHSFVMSIVLGFITLSLLELVLSGVKRDHQGNNCSWIISSFCFISAFVFHLVLIDVESDACDSFEGILYTLTRFIGFNCQFRTRVIITVKINSNQDTNFSRDTVCYFNGQKIFKFSDSIWIFTRVSRLLKFCIDRRFSGKIKDVVTI